MSLSKFLICTFLIYTITLTAAESSSSHRDEIALTSFASSSHQVPAGPLYSPLNEAIRTSQKPIFSSRKNSFLSKLAYTGAAASATLATGAVGVCGFLIFNKSEKDNRFIPVTEMGAAGLYLLSFRLIKLGRSFKGNSFHPGLLLTLNSCATAVELFNQSCELLSQLNPRKKNLPAIQKIQSIQKALVLPCRRAATSSSQNPSLLFPPTPEQILQSRSTDPAPLGARLQKGELGWLLGKIIKRAGGVQQFQVTWTHTRGGYSQQVTCALNNAATFTDVCAQAWFETEMRAADGTIHIPDQKWQLTPTIDPIYHHVSTLTATRRASV